MQAESPRTSPAGRLAGARKCAVDAGCVVAGAVWPLAFAPFGYFPIAFVSLAALFLAWRGCRTPRRAFLRGWLFGFGCFGAGMTWIYESFAFANVAGALAFVLTVGLVACLALYPAVLGWILVRAEPLGSDAPRLLAVYPAAWTLWEWVRGWAFTGFPWLQAGYSQLDGPAAGWLPVAGVHGAGALVALVAGGIAFTLLRRDRRAFALLGTAAAVWWAGTALARIDWVQPAGAPLEVAMVQGNVPQDQKWRREMRAPTLERYAELTRQNFDADLVVWPESAMPEFLDRLGEFTNGIRADAVERDSAVLTGALVREASGGPYLNAVVMLGSERGVYYKRRLVPFGEYMPFGFVLRPVAQALGIRLSDFRRGPAEQAPIRLGPHVLGVSICYEIAFSGAVRRDLPQAAMLVTVSNDAWFGDTIGPHQHLEIARVRAAETGRWLVRATNTGLSVIVSSRGEVRASLPQFEVAAGTFEVVPMQGETPYVRLGDTPVVFALAVWLAAGLAGARRTMRTAANQEGQ